MCRDEASDILVNANYISTEVTRNDMQQIAIHANANIIAAAYGDITRLQTEVTHNCTDIVVTRVLSSVSTESVHL